MTLGLKCLGNSDKYIFGAIGFARINDSKSKFTINIRPDEKIHFTINWPALLSYKVRNLLEMLVNLQIMSAYDCNKIARTLESDKRLLDKANKAKNVHELELAIFGKNYIISLTDDSNFTKIIYTSFGFESFGEAINFIFCLGNTENYYQILLIYNFFREIILNNILTHLKNGDIDRMKIADILYNNILLIKNYFVGREIIPNLKEVIYDLVDKEIRNAERLLSNTYGLTRGNYHVGEIEAGKLSLQQPYLPLKGTDINFLSASISSEQDIRLLKLGKCPFFTIGKIDTRSSYASWLMAGYN